MTQPTFSTWLQNQRTRQDGIGQFARLVSDQFGDKRKSFYQITDWIEAMPDFLPLLKIACATLDEFEKFTRDS